MKSRAFTLAETLVTLGIIGVVAALTMPTLISHHKDAVLKAQFKKAYALVSQAFGQAVSDLGYSPNCFYWTSIRPHHCAEYGEDHECTKYVDDITGLPIKNGHMGMRENCEELAEAFRNNLKIVQQCRGNAYRDGCIPDYAGFDDIVRERSDEDLDDDTVTEMTTGCPGFRKSAIQNNSWAYVLADGQIIFSYGGWHNQPVLFGVDINGKKGPNKWGYDVFVFQIYGNLDKDPFIMPSGASDGCTMVEKDGRYPAKMLRWANGEED